MIDFVRISTKSVKRGIIEVYPKFIVRKSKDLMIRGGDFYAIWDESAGLWSTDESEAIRLIDNEIDTYMAENEERLASGGNAVHVMHLWDAETGMIDRWHKYCQKQMVDNFHMLDEKIIFSNYPVCKEDYASRRLDYPLEKGKHSAWDKMISTLYEESEKEKIEWCIGSIVCGESKSLQKFAVFYGSAGTGKSTVLNIIQKLFDGYYSVFDAKALGSSSNAFALEAFRNNPLVGIQHDGDLSRIEDNTRINSLVSHELMTVNEKFKSTYSNRFKAFLFMGTNKPVKITDAKSGLIRRLIDISPSGRKLSQKEYSATLKLIDFELGAIAYHCRDVFLDNPEKYDDYIPLSMMGASNDFFNFMLDSYPVFHENDSTTLGTAWEMYKNWCDDSKMQYPLSKRPFKEELKNYFKNFEDRGITPDGTRVRSYYSGLKLDKFENTISVEPKSQNKSWIDFKEQDSVFDTYCADCPAQYATIKETPKQAWSKVTTTLSKLDTHELHYVKIPENHIVIDFDIPDEDGNKSLKKNLIAATQFPSTYAELSKSGNGIHLHYIYDGDVSRLQRIYDEHIEIKVYRGKSSLRRKLTKCNDLPIATISSGLPLKEGDKKLLNMKGVRSEKKLRELIERALDKRVHAGTKPNVDFINHILEEAYASDLSYDVSDMRGAVLAFAAGSTNQSEYCVKLVSKMKFKSEKNADEKNEKTDSQKPLVFYDIECFPNLFMVCYKAINDDDISIIKNMIADAVKEKKKPWKKIMKYVQSKKTTRLINPKPEQIEELLKFPLIGFNNRNYDNHMLYGCLMGYNNEQLYKLSQNLIAKDGGALKCGFSEAWGLSYTDIYDFASAGNKKSLKKLEIEMGIHHSEFPYPWNKPLSEDKWDECGDYCTNDVNATVLSFFCLESDWIARQILADMAGGTVNESTNALTQKFIFRNNRNPQNEFRYRNLAEPVFDLTEEEYEFLNEIAPEMMSHTHGEAGSLLPYFPGYEYKNGKSTYRGEEIGEGGKVYAEPGMYGNVALLDIGSQHPHSAMMEILFGVEFTRRFYQIVYARMHIKHKEWDIVNSMLDGVLAPYVQKVIDGEITSKDLANALKTAINSVYGLTKAGFKNRCKDDRNIDNIVAKRGALFMTDLKFAVQERGFTVAHIKTDSIKIPDATPEIIQFVMDFGKDYGYTFEHEATYDRMCLVNDAVYIAKYKTAEECEKMYGYIPGDNYDHSGQWTATGTQFRIPYVFKTLFSHEDIIFEDLCETKSVKDVMYIDMNENLPDVSAEEKELAKLETKYKKGELSDMMFEDLTSDLIAKIAEGHDYRFIGRVGLFCPMKSGAGGGELMVKRDNRYSAVTGTKGYRWMETEMVEKLGREGDVDLSYYRKLVDDAVEDIGQYGDFEWFVSDDPYYPDGGFMHSTEPTIEELPLGGVK